jgi:type I restriction enzyme M protein
VDFDRNKPADRRDQVLMLDARNVFRKLTRKIYDFTPEQLASLTAIVWLYRGQPDRFISLVQSYLDRTIAEAAAIADPSGAFQKACTDLADAAAPFLQTLPAPTEDAPSPNFNELTKERDDAVVVCFASIDQWTARVAEDWAKPCTADLASQHARLTELEALAHACRDMVKDVDLVAKLATRLVDAAEKEVKAAKQNGDGNHAEWDGRAVGRLEKDLDARRKVLVEQLKRTAYFQRQAHWLLSRFPEAKFVAVPGLCRVVTRADIEAADWSLTPGRYVSVAATEVDEDFDFEQALRDIHIEMADLNREACALATTIQTNFEGLGI